MILKLPDLLKLETAKLVFCHLQNTHPHFSAIYLSKLATSRSDALDLQIHPTLSVFTYLNINLRDYKGAFVTRKRKFGMTLPQILKTKLIVFSNATIKNTF